jgi:hypothetical protein
MQLKDLAPSGCSTTHDAKKRASVLAPISGFAAAKVYSQPDFTWFYLNEELIAKLEATGLHVERYLAGSPAKRDEGKYRLSQLRAEHVAKNESLFREVLLYSTDTRDQRMNRTKRAN